MIEAYKIAGGAAVKLSESDLSPLGRVLVKDVVSNAVTEFSRGRYSEREIQDFLARKTGVYLVRWPDTPEDKIADHQIHVSESPTQNSNYVAGRVWFEEVFTDRPQARPIAQVATEAVTEMKAVEEARIQKIASERQKAILRDFANKVASIDLGITPQTVLSFIADNPQNPVVIAVKAELQEMLDLGWGE